MGLTLPYLLFYHNSLRTLDGYGITAIRLTDLDQMLDQMKNEPDYDSGVSLDYLADKVDELLHSSLIHRLSRLRPDLVSVLSDAHLGEKPYILEDVHRVTESVIAAIDLFERETRKTLNLLTFLYFLLLLSSLIIFLDIGLHGKVLYSQKDLRTKMNERLLSALEKERNIIAYELHDDVAQKLAMVKSRLEDQGPKSREELEQNACYLKECLEKVRMIAGTLRSPYNVEENFDTSIEKLCVDFSMHSSINLTVKKAGLKTLTLGPQEAVHIYRIIQEFLNNSLKHSEADNISLNILYTHPELKVSLRDDGRGFNTAEKNHKGIGLDSIQFRLDLLRAESRYISKEGEGVELSFTLNIKNEDSPGR